ncbi:MAG TPA: ATP-binding protein [Candidatus Rifleibacterium sp.]|nr:ATP-binding protein [Candidatus Rifleibacterium sp.]HPT45454.1 ATP-binding protein [Candidatus Rifleibacterium sp.]
MKIAICSGKGGTGKTTVSLSLAWTLGQSEEFTMPVNLLDCDVEEPNCHLFLHCDYQVPEPVFAEKPLFDMTKCIGCGRCANKCRYNAIAMVKGTPLVFNDMCHSCGVCGVVCSHGAIKLQPGQIGEILHAEKPRYFDFAYGVLKIGESQSPLVISKLHKSAPDASVTILDGPPGTACSAVKTIGAAEKVILVTEPTPFGAHDLSLALNLCNELQKPAAIIINRSDENDGLIEEIASQHGVPVIGKIPFSREYARACSEGRILAAEYPTLRPTFMSSFSRLINEATIPVRHTFKNPGAIDSGESPSSASPKDGSYQEITILSGKGGTGKTSVTAAFATLADSRIFADCDVDAANLRLLLNGRNLYSSSVSLGSQAIIDPRKCRKCNKCLEACRFEAIDIDPETGACRVNELHCEGCGLCIEICPNKAIKDQRSETGKLMISEAGNSTLIHADLNTAAENSGKLVSMVRDLAFAVADQKRKDWLICDGPPGTACPAISTVTGSDRVVLVTEPSVAALHDLERVINLVRHFGLTPEIIINKADINASVTRRIHDLASSHKYKVIGEIPFDESVKQSIKAGVPVTQHDPNCPASLALINIWNRIKETRNENRNSRN